MNIKCYKLLFGKTIYIVTLITYVYCHVKIQDTQLSVNSWWLVCQHICLPFFILFRLCFYLTQSKVQWVIHNIKIKFLLDWNICILLEYRSFHVGIIIFRIITLYNYLYVIKCRMRIVNRTKTWLALHSVNKGNNKITELRIILQRESQTHNYINRQNQSTTGKLWKPEWPWLGTGISKEMVGWIRF